MADPLPIVCPFCEHVPDNCEVRVCAKHREHDKAPILADAAVGMAVREVAANAMRARDAAEAEVTRLDSELQTALRGWKQDKERLEAERNAARTAVARISPLLFVLDQWRAYVRDDLVDSNMSGPDLALVNAIEEYMAGDQAPRVITLALCEFEEWSPRPGALYQFDVHEGCDACARATTPNNVDAEGFEWPASPSEEVGSVGRFRAYKYRSFINITDNGIGIARTKSTRQAIRIMEALAFDLTPDQGESPAVGDVAEPQPTPLEPPAWFRAAYEKFEASQTDEEKQRAQGFAIVRRLGELCRKVRAPSSSEASHAGLKLAVEVERILPALTASLEAS